MRIFLFLTDKILTFSLPTDIEGSFSFDADLEEESKLINVEARNGEWVIYSVDEVRVVDCGQSVDSTILSDNSFYVINRMKNNYLNYISMIKILKWLLVMVEMLMFIIIVLILIIFW